MIGSSPLYGGPGSAGGTMAEAVFGGAGYEYPRSAPSLPSYGLAVYTIRKTELEKAYSQLTFKETIRARGVFRMLLVLVSFGWLLYFVLSKLSFIALPAAHAEQPVTASSTFIPPLGLPQGIFDIIIFMFALVMVFVVGAAAYAAFLAKSKSAKAASFVEHLGGFILWTVFGTAVPRR